MEMINWTEKAVLNMNKRNAVLNMNKRNAVLNMKKRKEQTLLTKHYRTLFLTDIEMNARTHSYDNVFDLATLSDF